MIRRKAILKIRQKLTAYLAAQPRRNFALADTKSTKGRWELADVALGFPCEIEGRGSAVNGKPGRLPPGRVQHEKERRRVSVEEGASCPSYTSEVGRRSGTKRRAVASERALPGAATAKPKGGRARRKRATPQNARPTNRLTVYLKKVS